MVRTVSALRAAASALAPAFAALVVLAPAVVPARADPVDCFPDRVALYAPGPVSSPPPFNSWQPGIVLGPPGNSTPTNGTLTVVSLGRGGRIVVEFTDNAVVDGPGPDFIVFENPFFCTAAPVTAADPWSSFAEPGLVEASNDGVEFHAFPYDAGALAQVTSICTDRSLIAALHGLAGLTPSFTGDWTVADDPAVFDPAAPGGVSGHGGDAFDLAAVGLSRARFVRITDPNLGIGVPGASEGFDLDAVVALHAVATDPGPDADGDGLADATETQVYGTSPSDPDSDGDGVGDGVEAATCHPPMGAAAAPFFAPSLDLEIAELQPTVLRWNTLGPGISYDLVRGNVAALRSIGGLTDLGVVTCLENDSTDLSNRGLGDAALPPAGQAFFYVARPAPKGAAPGYGLSTSGQPRVPASGDCL
jgi:hypothetical protein